MSSEPVSAEPVSAEPGVSAGEATASDAAALDRLKTPLCELLGVRYPIIQTGMGWVSGATLTAATAEAGGFGILASATMTLEELAQAIAKVKARTTAPFGVNLLPNQADLAKRIALLVQESIPVASFAGAPSAAVVQELNDAGITSIVTVGAKRHAEKMVGIGVSALIAQGGEGGGHTGSIPTSLLLPQVVDACAGTGVPVIGAGGFYDGRGLVAALAYGADGIAMGTRFLLSAESQVPANVKELYLKSALTATVVTEAIDGAPQRVIRTDMIDALEKSPAVLRFPKAAMNALRFSRESKTSLLALLKTGREMKSAQDLTWAQVALAANAPMMTKASMVDGRPEVGILPTGQVVGAIGSLPPVAEILETIIAEAAATLVSLR